MYFPDNLKCIKIYQNATLLITEKKSKTFYCCRWHYFPSTINMRSRSHACKSHDNISRYDVKCKDFTFVFFRIVVNIILHMLILCYTAIIFKNKSICYATFWWSWIIPFGSFVSQKSTQINNLLNHKIRKFRGLKLFKWWVRQMYGAICGLF